MKPTLALGGAWVASAAAAVGVGFLAVSLVDASAAPETQPLAATGTSTTSAAPTTAPSGVPSGEQATVGGTVFASCAGEAADLASAPAPGWAVDDSSKPGEVEFENGTQKVEIAVSCAAGSPQFVVEGPRADDGGGSPGSTSPGSGSSGSPSSSSGTDDSGRDDSSGRGSGGDGSGGDDSSGGGHGSDDSGGDDSSDRDGGGHGSDD
jgi:hypothetical protein